MVETAAIELSNTDARILYNNRLKQIDTSGPLTLETAARVHAARNTLKQEIRNLMADKGAAEQLANEQPLRPLEYYIEKYSAEGYQGEALWKRIIEGGTTPNKTVNQKFGL